MTLKFAALKTAALKFAALKTAIVLLCVATAMPVRGAQSSTLPANGPDGNPVVRAEAKPVPEMGNRFPWFDSAKGELRFVPPYIPPNATVASSDTPDTPDTPRGSGRGFLQRLLHLALAVLLVVVTFIVVWALIEVYRRRREVKKKQNDAGEKARRLETLLPEVQARMDSLDTDTELALGEGRYRDAIVYYFSYVLVELDKAGRIVMDKAKTNHDYARELRDWPELLQLYLHVMRLFERTYYGAMPIDRNMFLTVWEERVRFRQVRQTPATPNIPPVVRSFLFLLLTLPAMSGCSKYWSDAWTDYLPESRDKSINGNTAFLAKCKAAGGKCRQIDENHTPEYFDHYDCICWFRSDSIDVYGIRAALRRSLDGDTFRKVAFEMPDTDAYSISAVEISYLRQWLKAKPGRTVVIVGERYRANVEFWTRMHEIAPQEHRMWCRMKLDAANEQEMAWILMTPEERAVKIMKKFNLYRDSSKCGPQNWVQDGEQKSAKVESAKVESGEPFWRRCGAMLERLKPVEQEESPAMWFRFEPMESAVEAVRLEGDTRWTDSLPSGPPLRVTQRLVPLDGTKTTLAADGMPLVCEREECGGNIYILQSGLFTLNYGMTIERNREIASRLIDTIGKKKRILVMNGPSLLCSDKSQEVVEPYRASPFSVARLTAFSVLFWNLFLLGMIALFWKFPVWGRAKRIQPPEIQDFGRHLAAYGHLLEKTGNEDWAKEQLEKLGDVDQ